VAQTHSVSFVVRLRVPQDRSASWWGEAQHVETGERVAFRDQAKLLAFLQRYVQELAYPTNQRR
jgi:hypothetical protein